MVRNRGTAMRLVRKMLLMVPVVASTAASAQTLGAHPRLILDSPTLSRLRASAAADTPQWQALKSYCDSFIGGKVNLPDGNTYPNPPDIGQGYQGDGYRAAVLGEGLCYQALVSTDPSAAAPYGNKARDVLMAMSTPSGSGQHGQNPCTDDGYGIRNYGVGMGIGYDWVYPLLSSAQRQQVYTTANAWLASFADVTGCSGFEYVIPLDNYFAGFFHADTVIALATNGENPNAPALWSDWQNTQYMTASSHPPHVGVQPYYPQHMTGGGWPEGFGNYGPLATFNMSMPAWEVKTATGSDLIHAAAPFSYPIDAADYLMHFTWPSRDYIDDRDTNHANGIPTPPVGTANTGMFMQVLGTLRYWKAPHADVFQEYTNEVNAATGGYGVDDPWAEFLFWNPNGPTQPLTILPLSYFATGMNAVAARSDWGNGASWMSFRAGPYIDDPGAGEEGFDQGSLAVVRGKTPLLVNASGWIVHEPNGSDDETRYYTDSYGSFDGSVYSGNRTIDNIYYVRKMNGSQVVNRYGQEANTLEDDGVRTAISRYEDGGGYVDMLATHLEDMYRLDSSGHAQEAAWAREVIYLRPNRFVVYDRTTEGSSGEDQFLAFHFPANPTAGSAPSGSKRIDIASGNVYAGAMTTVLPQNTTFTTIGIYPSNDGQSGSNPVKAWQVQVRSPSTAVSQQWLTVFDTSTSASTVAAASKITVTSGTATGTLLASAGSNSAVIVNTGAAGSTISGSIAYTVPAAKTTHVITELPANKTYDVTATVAGGNHNISVEPGTAFRTSAHGVLSFDVTADGTVTPINGNQPPVADAGNPQTVKPLAKVALDGSGSFDPDGSIASYSWTQTTGIPVKLYNASKARAAFRAPRRAGTLGFELTVTDHQGASASATVTVTVGS